MSSSSAPSFAIIIPTWNNLAYLRLCIESVRKNSSRAHEITVHVNEGADGTREYLDQERIRYTHSPTNVGVCHAVNIAARASDSPLVCLLNDDMYCLPGWDAALEARIAALESDCYCISGTMIEPVFSRNPCAFVADFGTSLETFREVDLLAAQRDFQLTDWYGSCFCPLIMPRPLWDKIGGLSEEFSPGMSSDPDMAMKLWKVGCRVFLGIGESRVYHFQCKSTGRVEKNPGPQQFLAKWRITQASFNRHYLRKGERATSVRLPEPRVTLMFLLDHARSKLKLAACALRPSAASRSSQS